VCTTGAQKVAPGVSLGSDQLRVRGPVNRRIGPDTDTKPEQLENRLQQSITSRVGWKLLSLPVFINSTGPPPFSVIFPLCKLRGSLSKGIGGIFLRGRVWGRRGYGWYPAEPPDGSGQTFASAVESGAELTTNLVPSDRSSGARIQVSSPKRDFALPSLFGVIIDLSVKAVDERVGKCSPCCRGVVSKRALVTRPRPQPCPILPCAAVGACASKAPMKDAFAETGQPIRGHASALWFGGKLALWAHNPRSGSRTSRWTALSFPLCA